MKLKITSIKNIITTKLIQSLALPSNHKYGTAIFSRGGIEIISSDKTAVEAWVGGVRSEYLELCKAH